MTRSGGTRVDYLGLAASGVPIDLGWGWAVWDHAAGTVTRWCKSCGVRATTSVNPVTGRVDEAVIDHRAACVVIQRIVNNPAWS